MKKMVHEISSYLKEHGSVIAISGKSGCGNTTVSKKIAQTLDIEFVNYTFRSLAKERGVSLETIIAEAAKGFEVDRLVDKKQVELSCRTASVLASRLAIWMRADAILKIYLYAEKDVRITRIKKREGWTLEQTITHTESRDQKDHQRYLQLYGIDNDNYNFVDVIIDTGAFSPNEICNQVIHVLYKRIFQKSRA